jgi:hypothetical protein
MERADATSRVRARFWRSFSWREATAFPLSVECRLALLATSIRFMNRLAVANSPSPASSPVGFLRLSDLKLKLINAVFAVNRENNLYSQRWKNV